MTARAKRVAKRANRFGRLNAVGKAGPYRMVDNSVAPALAADMLAYLRALGVDDNAVARRAGIDPSALSNGNDRIPGRTMAALWREAESASSDPDIGLHMSVAFNPGALDIVGYVMLSSHTAAEAVRRGARFMRLLNDGLDLQVERGSKTTICRLVVLPRATELMSTESRHVVDSVVMGMVHQLRLLLQRHVVPTSVTVTYAKPTTGTAQLTHHLGVTPRFNSDATTVTLANADLDEPLRSANAMLLTSFESVADAALASLAARTTLAGRVDAEIMCRLKGGLPTLAEIAKALDMSARNLQRGLADTGTTFQSQLDDARRELAIRHLMAPTATVAQVAWLVGFSEPSAFHRAFRRWTGRSPKAAYTD